MLILTKTLTLPDRPLILISNDDGISAPGLAALVDTLKDFGELWIVAPDGPQSGMGHAITVSEPLRLERTQHLFQGFYAYQSSGTPADCVKLAVSRLLHQKPDLVVSGINHGSNSSINAIYSGTVSAAMEGAIEGIPAIAFSLTDYAMDADFNPSQPFIKSIVRNALNDGIPEGNLLNVNIPAIKASEIKGIKICRQAHAKWEENFDEREDPNGQKYYWLVGNFVNYDKGTDTDEWALDNNYIALTPVQYDLTAYHSIPFLNEWNFNSNG